MDVRNYMGWGYVLAIIERACDRKNPRSTIISTADWSEYFRRPGRTFPLVLRKAMNAKALTEEDHMEIAGAMDLVDADYAQHEPENGIGLDAQSKMILSYYHYDTEGYTVKEAAEILGVSVQAVYKLLKNGTIDGMSRKGKMTVFKHRFDAYAEQRKQERRKEEGE